uniref:Uncharacterized protein n=1 Tax=Rhizophora mucronata TaxID=61149 RepID=A0A2P2R1P2_RHIMU
MASFTGLSVYWLTKNSVLFNFPFSFACLRFPD